MDDNNFPVAPIGSTPSGINPPELTTPPTKPNVGKKSKKWLILLILVPLLLASSVFATYYYLSKNNPDPETPANKTTLKETAGITTVPTMLDEITADSTWCGTFQMVWNDMKKEIVGGDVAFFDGNPAMVDNLNKETFKSTMLSDDYYYKTYGLKTLKLKAEIERGIKEKFNETSDVLDDLDWSDDGVNDPNNPDVDRYLFYAMLRRNFEYQYELAKLDKQKFDSHENVAFFGTKGVDSGAYQQFDVLYYNSKDDFAIQINTKDRDEVIFVKNPEGKTFNEIYEKMNAKKDAYKGSRGFQNSDDYIDDFKAPNLTMKEKKKYDELVDRKFPTIKGYGEIKAAIQTVQFKINEKGGEIKSEAVIDVIDKLAAIPEPKQPEHRYFYLDDTFAIFLRETSKPQPYFAARVNDITKFQN
ncbi:hypothetical protein FWF74_03030 [Candidatus Saccharibacteria bacterium]|nr:hypothetical protein [Candidatus Saccharibacteria bacterium]MCL1962932.1 hypothetical protein [Candidatus Saccharibacteria bacterium]